MDETHYSISETGKLVGVESHVLRYWEDELQLKIPRNEKGHRYYTELHIRLFQKIKELKAKGYQLKAIEQVLKKMIEGGIDMNVDEELEQDAVKVFQDGGTDEHETGRSLRIVPKPETGAGEALVTAEEKMEQFQQIMNHIIGKAIEANNDSLSQEISRQVNDKMVKELEYMMRISDEKEEERFKMLDETLRAYQKEGKGRAEAAAAKMPFFKRRKFGRSGKKMA